MNKKIILDIFFGLTIVITAFLCLWGVRLPYVGLYNANNNYLALASKNFLHFGYAALHFLPTYFVGSTLPAVVPYYLHHPVLFFLFEAVAFQLFGTANWVVHLSPGLFVFGTLVMLYLLVKEVSDEEVARWTVVWALLSVLVSFFWKFMMFEQASLFFTLTTLYNCVLYWKTSKRRYLWLIGIAAMFGGATDWYGGYLFFGFCYLFVAKTGKRIWPTFFAYLVGELIGLSSYIAAMASTGNIRAFWEGYSARGFTSELMSLSYWPARLLGVTVIRLVVYASPFMLFGIWSWLRQKRGDTVPLVRHVGAVLFIIGSVSFIFLPSTIWGHSYFLYYLFPWMALVCGMWFADVVKRKPLPFAVFVLILALIWSTGISVLKRSQVTKQSWKYDFGRDVSVVVPMYSTVGVLEYPGDVLQNYFLIDAMPFSEQNVTNWVQTPNPRIRYVLITCKGVCTASEDQFIRTVMETVGGREYRYGQNSGWLIDHTSPGISNKTKGIIAPQSAAAETPSIILRWYRYIRDALGSTQI